MEEQKPPYINLDCDELSIDFLMPSKGLEKLFNFDFTPYINDSNTPQANTIISDLEFTYSVTHPQNYNCGFKFDTCINNKIIACFCVNIGKTQGVTTSYNTIVIYSTFIQVFGRDFVLDFLEKNFNTKYFQEVPSRFDIACDIPETKTNLLATIDNKKNPFTSTIGYDHIKGAYETYYFGKKSGNSSVLIRIYDKIKDSFKKGKSFMYDFGGYTDVTRVEIQFGRNRIKEMCNKEFTYISWRDILENKNNIINNLFFTQIKQKIPYFSDDLFTKFEFTPIRRHKNITDIEAYFLQTHQIPHWHKVNGAGIINKIYDACGSEGLFQLFFEDRELKEQEKIVQEIALKFVQKKEKKRKVRLKNKTHIKEKMSLLDKITNYLFNENQSVSTKASKTFNKSLKILNT